MPDSLQSLLIECTVKIWGDKDSHGTGFFVAPNLVLTAAHVTEASQSPSGRVRLRLADGECWGKVVFAGDPERDDFALVQTKEANDVTAVLDSDVKLGDQLLTYGFTKACPTGEPVTLEYEGSHGSNGSLIKLKQGQLVPGMSGAALVNQRTARVIGVVLDTRSRVTDLGGHALATQVVLDRTPADHRLGQRDFAIAARWERLVSVLHTRDLATSPNHYWLFPQEKVDVVDAFIEPRYTVLRYEDLERCKESASNAVADCVRILEQQELLFLFGPYGSGKSILTKRVQRHLWERGYDVTYLRCSDIKDRLQLLDQLTSERGPAARPLVIALDGYDEANLLRLDKKDIKREVLTALFEISFRPRVFVILNSRLIPMSEESIYLGIANLMYDLRQQDSTTVVELKPFRKPQIEAWLDAYSNAKAKRGYEQRLFREDLGHLHKNLANACHNPLFLYMLAARFYEAGIERLTDVYDLYESFVDNTVTGKFRFEKRQAASIAEVSRHYRAFLREMALAISATNDLEFDSKTLDAWNLDANDRLYSIPYATVRETIEKTAERLLDPVDLGDIDRRRLINNVLTCYFLAESGDRWRFTDNNILFFLLAEALLLATKHTVTKGSIEGFASAFTSALNSPTIPLHPLSVELLLLRLASEPSEERERISEFLAELFRMPLVLTAGSGSKQLDPQEVRRLATLLVVIFLRVSERKYSELSDFLSSLQIHLRMLAKTDVRAYDILRSFFRSLTVREGRFDGFDFDGFNFQGSLFESVKFEKCRFCDPVFDHLVLDGERAEFRHCTLERVDARSVSGRARFEASEVELRLTDPGDLDLHFENCHVKDLNIHAKRHTHPAKVRVSVDGGRVDHLILRKLVVERLELRNCEHPVLKLEGSKVWLLRVNARCTSKRIVSKDGQSKIYEVKD